MHPNKAFRSEDRAMLDELLSEIGFGMIFAETPDGPRVAHVPLLRTEDGRVRFHLSRGNALTKHLDGATALAVVNGPDGYISPRWYPDGGVDHVPTWNYVAIELEGHVRQLDEDGLIELITALSNMHEARIATGKPWTMDKLGEKRRNGLVASIVGFELEIAEWRETLKLSQNKLEADRMALADGIEREGNLAVAQLMRSIAQ